MRPFTPRPIASAGLVSHQGWALKRYAIVFGESPVDWPSFEGGIDRVLCALPEPAVTPERLGVGFLITHRGAGADYVVLAWWDRENELPLAIAVRDQAPGAEWRSARAGESVCVWDLEVVSFERDAYVTSVLAADWTDEDRDARRARYLARRLDRTEPRAAAAPGSASRR